MVCDLNQKIDVLWSFIKSHVKKKVLVFMQVNLKVIGRSNTTSNSVIVFFEPIKIVISNLK